MSLNEENGGYGNCMVNLNDGNCVSLADDINDTDIATVSLSCCSDFDYMDASEGVGLQLAPISPGVITRGGQVYNSPIQTVRTVQTVETVVSTNNVVPFVVDPPVEGMVFKCWKDIEAYFKEYAQQHGFGVSRVSSAYKDKTRERRAVIWKCECWGAPNMRAQREAKKRAKAMDVSGTGGNVNGVIGQDELRKGQRKSKKCHCEVQLYASINGKGEWVIRTAHLEHKGHNPTPSKANLVKEYRMKNYTSSVRKRLFTFYEEGVPVSRIRGCLSHEKDKLPSVKDLQHELYKDRKLKMEGGDAVAMMKYFEKMQADNQNFFHAHRLDEEGRLKDVLWVDARSRAAYDHFGDVVCFDATYLTNEYELPFANFVGVNHHGQSILLGCALVSHETCETYAWVFKQWLSCMGNRPPLGILTDQAASMRRPLAEIMPSSRHRWCIWHIMSKFGDKLGKCKWYADFKSPLKALIYESFTVDEFEVRWCDCIKKYELEDNEWLQDLFNERHMWVPCFIKEHFWAGMKMTQRVESINSFFDGFVNRKTKLYEFPQKYTRAMTKRVEDETEADARSTKYVRRLVSGFKVERLYQKIYTDAKFQEIQKELSRMMYCYGREERVIDDNTVHYFLEDRVWVVPEGLSEEVITDRRRIYCVKFNRESKEVFCNCCKFETFGILCKHSIRVLDQNLVFDIPDKYILDRWRKDVIRKHTRVKVAYHDPSDTKVVQRSNKIMNHFEPICDEASIVDDDTVDMVMLTLSNLKIEVTDRRKKFIEANGVLTLPSTQYPTSGRGSTSNIQTPSSVRKRSHGSQEGSEEVVECAEVPDQVVTQQNHAPDSSQTHTPDSSQPLMDPRVKKRRRGRPKGSRNKPYSETGYKTKNKKQGKDVQLTSDVQPTDADMDMDLPLSAMRATIPRVPVAPAKGKKKTKRHIRNRAPVKLATCFEEDDEVSMEL